MADFYVFWCAESKSSNQVAPSRTDFLLHWVILSHRVKNKVLFTVLINSKFLFQNLVNEKKWNWPTQITYKVTLESMNLLVRPFLLPLNASLGALLGVFFIRGFPQQQPAEISHHIDIKWIKNLLKYHEGVLLVS